MARVIAVFDDGTKAEAAISELEGATMVDKVHVVTAQGAESEGVEPVLASGSQEGGAVVGTRDGAEPIMNMTVLGDLGLGSEEEEFYRRNLDEGAQLISVETDDPDAVVSLLEKSGADRVDAV